MTTGDSSSLREGLSLRGEPERLPTVLTNALIAGLAVMAVLGLVELLITRRAGAVLQPVAATLLIVWALVMLRRGAPRPELLLAVAVTLSFAYLVAAAIDPVAADVTDTSPIAIIVGAGVIALAVGGRLSVAVGVYSLVIAALATIVVQVDLGAPAIEIAVDAGNAFIVMAVAFAMVRSIRSSVDDGFARYRGLVESAPVAVVEVDLAAWVEGRDRISLGPMNTTASSVLGYADGRTETSLARQNIPSEFAAILDVAATAPTGTEVRTLADGRTFKVGWRVDAASGRVTLSGTDITAQRKSEEELTGQVSARDRFIATVSHELRTPLTGAMGMLEVVRAGDIADSERDEMIDLALMQVKDMADIVEDLLVAARAANGMLTVHPSVTDVAASVSDVLSVLPDAFIDSIEPEAKAWADPVRVRQIVKNLLTNAVRYGGPQRGVTVRTEGRAVVVEVTDDGPPLAADFVARMFEPYERVGGNASPESVGLGLTVARTLARLMGGEVTYHHDGRAVFRLTLPVMRDGATPP
ncbi:MAG: HAMP domain-containing sensor histidine kinase [Acidimicrobiia bacterium]